VKEMTGPSLAATCELFGARAMVGESPASDCGPTEVRGVEIDCWFGFAGDWATIRALEAQAGKIESVVLPGSGAPLVETRVIEPAAGGVADKAEVGSAAPASSAAEARSALTNNGPLSDIGNGNKIASGVAVFGSMEEVP
jgi:hypothetical protein